MAKTPIRRLPISIVTVTERMTAIHNLMACIDAHSGWVVASRFFSDLAMSLTIEMEEGDIMAFVNAVQASVGHTQCDMPLLERDSDAEWQIQVHLTFGNGSGKLKINIPEVPG